MAKLTAAVGTPLADTVPPRQKLPARSVVMEHTIVAPDDGTVDAVIYGAGEQVAEGVPLVIFATAEA